MAMPMHTLSRMQGRRHWFGRYGHGRTNFPKSRSTWNVQNRGEKVSMYVFYRESPRVQDLPSKFQKNSAGTTPRPPLKIALRPHRLRPWYGIAGLDCVVSGSRQRLGGAFSTRTTQRFRIRRRNPPPPPSAVNLSCLPRCCNSLSLTW